MIRGAEISVEIAFPLPIPLPLLCQAHTPPPPGGKSSPQWLLNFPTAEEAKRLRDLERECPDVAVRTARAPP